MDRHLILILVFLSTLVTNSYSGINAFAVHSEPIYGIYHSSGSKNKPGNITFNPLFNSHANPEIKTSPSTLQVYGLKCEKRVNPIGISELTPGLSWKIRTNKRNVHQTAYRIMAASSRDLLRADSADLWDTGIKPGIQSLNIPYSGKELKSHHYVFWKVKVWCGSDSSDWSPLQFWQTGPVYHNEWKGRWIGFDKIFPWDRDTMHSRLSSRYFRNEFFIPENKKIRNAVVYISGLGLYEMYINGSKSSQDVLSPTPTDYTKNVKYNTYEVSTMLKPGRNAIGVVLGNGRYYTMRQHHKANKIKNFGFPKVLLNLYIWYTDGSRDIISTDEKWKGTTDGPIRSNNEYDGEEYDARKEFNGWSFAGFDDSQWMYAKRVEEPGGFIEAQMNPNMGIIDTLQPVSVKKDSSGNYILDLGQNMTGWLKIRVKGDAGTRINLRFAESLNKDGSLFTANLRDAKATDSYILKGSGSEEWQPSFIYHGFRYVEISGYPGTPRPENFQGMVISDQLTETGSISFSNPLLNKIYSAACWSVTGNYKGMPVDCPQRNERQPWLGDRATGSYGESFIFDNSALYTKWLDDIMHSQRADGSIPDVAPAFWRYYSDNMTWAGTYLMVAEMLLNQFGDEKVIHKHYPFMKKWMNYMKIRYLKDGIMTKDSYGDWCPPPESIESGRNKSGNIKHPSKLISTAYYYYYLGLMQKFAEISGYQNHIDEYREEAQKVARAFNREFLSTAPFGYGNNNLTDNLLALAFGIVPDTYRTALISRLKTILAENDNHLSCGLIGIQWLLRTLSRNGMKDLAFQIATNKTYPSWGYMIENGATTFWELWNGNTAAPDMNSQNHVMMIGDLIIWFYEDLAGIRSHPDYPAFKKILMAPSFPKGLDHLNASYECPEGTISSNWTFQENDLIWDIIIPPNSTAEIHIPSIKSDTIYESGMPIDKIKNISVKSQSKDKTILELGSGSYQLKVTNPELFH